MKHTDLRTLTGYQQHMDHGMTKAMEDYLELIYRMGENEVIRISELAARLHVRPSSASRMVAKLAENRYLQYEKYGVIRMTEEGNKVGEYLQWRHDVLSRFFCQLNQTENEWVLVEQIAHFMDKRTVSNLAKLLDSLQT